MYPKGLMLYESHKNSDGSLLTIPKDFDFVIAAALSDMKEVKEFNNHVQEAYNADIPCVAYVKADLNVYMKKFSLANPLWPDINSDPYIKILDKLFLSPSKTSMYAIHGILLDVRTQNTNGTGAWIAAVSKHLRELFQKRYFGVPVYIMTEERVLTLFPNNNADPQVFFANENFLSTVSISVTDDTGEPISSPKPNWKGIKFWWYSSQKLDFLSKTDYSRAPIFQYRGGDKEKLYKELGFIKKNPDDTPSDDENQTEPEPTPKDEISPELREEIIAELSKVEDILRKIRNML